jgi:molybdopterin-guanine dinucleotide biosynthesis protein MobB
MGNSLERSEGRTSIPVVSIIGHSGSGKTTLLEKLIREMKRRGYRLAVVKHHHHPDLQLDSPGKDSWRFAQAGADHVTLAGPDQVAHVRYFDQEPTLGDALAAIQDVDLILTEGYKHADAPKIEVSRGESTLISTPEHLIAVVSDRRFGVDVPHFDLEDVAGLATFVEARFLTKT